MAYGSRILFGRHDVSLPPGQRRIAGFPRFGAHLSGPPPAVPDLPVLQIRGAVTEAFDIPLTALATLPRRELTADFHCVAGWSATNLRWQGVSFATVYATLIQPALTPGTPVTHFLFRGLDGWRSVVSIEDALADEVLIAERLDGRPLDGDHGAPVRLVSPKQYGYVSTKHLCRIEVHAAEPAGMRSSLMRLLSPHPRARVWEEERHRYLPAWSVRSVYRTTIAYVIDRGGRKARDRPRPR
ncbi:MAG: molybdopterin-dependent oxidoreductase [Actinomycetota bacterium]|nr:molybdopterin-dependent oxidoreductase [Actinomycetota bacterium]